MYSIKNKFLIYNVSLGLIVIIFNFILSLRYFNNTPTGDELEYESIAKAILQGKSTCDYYAQDVFPDIGLVVTPVYSSIIAAVYFLAGSIPQNVYIFQILLNIVIVILYFNILKLFSSNLFSFIVSIIFSLYYPLWRMNFALMMEIPSIFLLFIIVYFTYRFLQNFERKYFYTISILWSLLIFMNNRFIVHFIILYTFWIIIFLKNKKFEIRNFLYAFIILILVLTPWHIRQYLVYNSFVIFTPFRVSFLNVEVRNKILQNRNESYNYFRNYEDYIKEADSAKINIENKEKFKTLFTIEKYETLKSEYQNRTWFDRLLFNLKENFRIIRADITLSGFEDARLVSPASKIHNIINLVYLLPAFILFPVGIYFSLKKKSIFLISLIIIIFSNILLNSIIACIERYRALTLPLTFLVSSQGVYYLYKFIKKGTINFKHRN